MQRHLGTPAVASGTHGLTPRSIGIIGGGAAGVLVALHLARSATEPLDITIYEPRELLGEGVAYSTRDDGHLLNVPAGGMTALPEEPDHFRAWAGVRESDFVARHRFATYLRTTLDAAIDAAPHVRLDHSRRSVLDLAPTTPPTLSLDDATQRSHDHVVIATGNAQPTRPEWLPPCDRVIADPWLPGALAAIPSDAHVACIGTGLTFVDVALTLARRDAQVRGYSRHGLLPAAHAAVGPVPTFPAELRAPLQILRWVRSHDDWRAALAALRPHTQRLWQAMTENERRQFLRLPMRYWEIHRHRMAPNVAAELHDYMRTEMIIVTASRPAAATLHDDGRITLVDNSGTSTGPFDYVVLCTGPSDDVRRSPGLLGRLVASGSTKPGPLDVGVDTDPVTGALRDGTGSPVANVHCIGTMRRGTLWETTAVPELRTQAASLARKLVEAHA